MQLWFKIFLLFSFIYFSCTSNDNKPNNKITPEDKKHTASLSKRALQLEPPYSNIDTLMINLKSAVFFQPDSLQMQKRMTKVGEDEFREGADDYLYYMHISFDYLEKQKLPVIEAKGKKYLKFLNADGKSKTIRLDSLQDLWGIYLFDPKKEPYYADIIDIESDYIKYFKD